MVHQENVFKTPICKEISVEYADSDRINMANKDTITDYF